MSECECVFVLFGESIAELPVGVNRLLELTVAGSLTFAVVLVVFVVVFDDAEVDEEGVCFLFGDRRVI